MADKKLTVKEMDDVIQSYCEKCEECDDCPVQKICNKILGDFGDVHPRQTEKAYTILMETHSLSDNVNHPSHYTNGGIECIDEMVMVFGEKTVADFCLCNVWKYRKRALHKNGQEDLDKADWYMKKYVELLGLEVNHG